MERDLFYNDLYETKMIFNNNYINNLIEGFDILNIYGREMIGKKIVTNKSENQDGDIKDNSSYNSRPITVEFLLQANSDEDMFDKFELLNYYLNGDDKRLEFTDNSDYFYIATLSDVEEIKNLNNKVISKITFYSQYSYKFKKDLNEISFNTSKILNLNYLYKVVPEEIEINLLVATNKLIITNVNNTKKIILDHDFNINDIIKIYPQSQQITVNNMDILNKLDLISNLEDFFIDKNDEIVVNTNSDIIISLREKRL